MRRDEPSRDDSEKEIPLIVGSDMTVLPITIRGRKAGEFGLTRGIVWREENDVGALQGVVDVDQ